MATRYETVLVDDIDGSDATETLTFGLDGKSYVLDLSDQNAEKFRKAFAPYAEAARKEQAVASARRSTTSSSSSTGGKRDDLQAIREWASKNGHSVSSRGRIAGSVVDAYDAAH
jgi:hypothetical protein